MSAVDRRPTRTWRRAVVGAVVALAAAALLALVGPGADPAGASTDRTYGGQPIDDILGAAAQHARADCGLGRDQLAAMMLAPTFSETGSPSTAAPSPMTLSRWDTQAALYAFGDKATPYQRAFWHPGIGLWQFDSAGFWDLTAATAINTETAARQAAEVMSSRYCASKATSTVDRMRYAWAPWYGCASGSVDCVSVYRDLSDGGPLRNYRRDEAVTRNGGMVQRSCRVTGFGELPCWYVDPARAEGWAGFASPNGAPTPISTPFYVFRHADREYRYWLREDSGYAVSVIASKPVRADARNSLTWTTVEGSGASLCDATAGRGACTPFGWFEKAVAGPRSIQVSGWAIDPDAADPTYVHVYVDGVGTNLRADRHRADVGAAFPHLGPNHGFGATIPAGPGSHQVCAYAIDWHGARVGNALLGCHTVEVPSGSPSGRFDHAAQEGPGSLRAFGWAMDPDTATAVDVHVYVDGVGRANVRADQARADVARVLPAWGAGRGWSATIGGLAPGDRQVCAYAIDRAAPGGPALLGCRTVSIGSGSPFGSIDGAVPGQVSARISGWALDPDVTAPVDVHVYADGRPYANVVANRSRPDVARAKPGWGPDHGFSVDVRPLGGGPHELCVFAINLGSGANVSLGCRTVQVSGVPFGALDVVAPGPVSVEVGGWAVDPDVMGPVDVHVYVDGVGRANVRADARRTDVAAHLGGWSDRVGISTTIGGIPAGAHQVCAYAIGVGAGGNTLLGCRQVTVEGGSPYGVVELVSRSGNQLRVAGWAVDPDTPGTAHVHVYVDGVGTSIRADIPRSDLAVALPTFGPAHGFDRTWTVPAGAREACIYFYNVGQGANAFLGCRAL